MLSKFSLQTFFLGSVVKICYLFSFVALVSRVGQIFGVLWYSILFHLEHLKAVSLSHLPGLRWLNRGNCRTPKFSLFVSLQWLIFIIDIHSLWWDQSTLTFPVSIKLWDLVVFSVNPKRLSYSLFSVYSITKASWASRHLNKLFVLS